MPKSPGLTAWLWLFSKAGRAKATLKPLSRPGLAWPISAGLGLAHSLRPGRKSTTLHHYQTPGRISEPFDTFRSSFERSTSLLHVHRLRYTFFEFLPPIFAHFRLFSTILTILHHFKSLSYILLTKF